MAVQGHYMAISNSVLLLDAGFGNFEAPVHNTQPRKSCLLQIRPVVVISHLHTTKSPSIFKQNPLNEIIEIFTQMKQTSLEFVAK